MRGKAAESEENIPINRITPAYAGKSLPRQTPSAATQDHPRLCGEKLLLSHCHTLPEGSPPPMRGKD